MNTETSSNATVSTEISQQLAWVHRDAATLVTEDLTELRYRLEQLIGDCITLKRTVTAELNGHGGKRTKTGVA